MRNFNLHPLLEVLGCSQNFVILRKQLEPISKIGRRGLPEIFERKARYSDDKYRGILRKKSRLVAENGRKTPGLFRQKLFLRWVLT